ncbi:MAG: T9SS type A sorting domain-containing protein [Ignavibacteriales bacterium]|nr:T9SS type A sorting domain-containing protein [Ignavibacteriales bacterium]
MFFHCQASEIHVSSVAALQAAINGASAGDVIVLDNGTYLNSTLAIGTSNITVKAGTPGGVLLNGTNAITISGSYVTFTGFQFTSGSIDGIAIVVSGSNDLLTQLNFRGYSAQKYINLQGQYDEVSFCNFENKPVTAPQGNLIHIAPNGIVPNYARIRYCSFKNMPGAGGDNGNECIRIANGTQSTYVCKTLVEFCYFENTGMGDSEAISVKSQENVLRYNTFKNNQDAMMVFRNGDNNIGYGNFFISAGGIRVKEANNIYCYNNYFENSGIGGNSDAVTYVYYTANTTNVLQNINFLYNTFVECGDIDLDKGATNNTWSNNIFQKSSGNIFIASSIAGISWSGNIYTGTLGLSIPSGTTNADPKLVKNSDGYYGLSSSSPAIDASNVGFPPILDIAGIDDDPSLLLDVSGRSRPVAVTLKDVGCSEYGATGAATNRPLKLSDVGPSYLGGPATSVEKDHDKNILVAAPTGFQLEEAYPNPFNPTTTIRFHILSTTHISLRVCDQLGREVVTLVDGIRSAGQYQVRWDAAQHPSGTYFCRLQTEQRTEIIRLLLLK